MGNTNISRNDKFSPKSNIPQVVEPEVPLYHSLKLCILGKPLAGKKTVV
jgi:hypothetical protein